MKNKAVAVCGIWIGYGIAMFAVAFGTRSAEAAEIVGAVGAFLAMFTTILMDQ